MDERTAAPGVQETEQVENIIRTLKDNGEPLIPISHNVRQVFDLVDRIIDFRRGRTVGNLLKEETDGEDVVAYITGAKTGKEYEVAARPAAIVCRLYQCQAHPWKSINSVQCCTGHNRKFTNAPV